MSESSALDHLVIASRTLDEGVQWVGDLLGVQPDGGGHHQRMGTHNRLLSLGNHRYLEIIAIDPDGPTPVSSRWFDLDNPAMHERLSSGPALITWVARVPDLDALIPSIPGGVWVTVPMERGGLRWAISLRDDGALCMNGAGPYWIQWLVDEHPAGQLPDKGCVLDELTVRHPDSAELMAVLNEAGIEDEVTVEPAVRPGLQARLSTPRGEVILDSHSETYSA